MQKKIKIKNQMYLVYTMSIFLPILLIGIFLLSNNYSLIYDHHSERLVSDNIRVRSIVFEVTTAMTNISDELSEDPLLDALLVGDYDSWEEANLSLKNYTAISDYYGRHTDISSITIYSTNPTLDNYGHIIVLDEAEQKEAWFVEAMSRPGYYWTTSELTNDFGVTTSELQLTHKIPINNGRDGALLKITISNNYLKNRIDNNELNVDMRVNRDPVFFSTIGRKSYGNEVSIEHDGNYYSYSGVGIYGTEEVLMEVSTFSPIKSDDRLYIISTDSNALSDIRRILLVTLGIVVTSIVIPLILIVKYTGQFTARIETLRSEMHRVSGGDYNIIEKFKGNDELVELFTDLQQMIASIKERDEEIFEANLKEQQFINHQQKMELEILSSKINPHFLYNTLETIRMKAFNVDDLEVANAVKLLGKYMRHNLESTGGAVTLKSELTYIESYLKIQMLRFGSRISYKIIVEESLNTDQIKLLPMLIQPIVENAFKHGHQETIGDGKIDVRIYCIEDKLCVYIEDNGVGMEQEALIRLRERLEATIKPEKKSFGLYNIHQRIRLYYGGNYGLVVKGNQDNGMTIGFEIPKVDD